LLAWIVKGFVHIAYLSCRAAVYETAGIISRALVEQDEIIVFFEALLHVGPQIFWSRDANKKWGKC
jgi:hypothetical protein